MTTPPPEREGENSPHAPQSPAGPQSPGGSPPSAGGPQSPDPGGHPDSPGGAPQAAPPGGPPQFPGSPASPAYSGPVPPGGWQQPIARPGGLPTGATLASWGSRVGATLLDALVLLVVLLVLIAPGIVVTVVSNGGALGIILILVGVLVYIAAALLYAAYFMQREGHRNGQTLGKQWVGIRVVRTDGQQYEWGAGLLRELVIKQLLFGFVGGFFLSIPTILDYLWPLWDDENRALHDMIAASRVIRA